MSGWPRVIEDADGNSIEVTPFEGAVSLYVGGITGDCVCLSLSIEASAKIIAAVTDAAKVVTGEKA